MVFWLLVQRIDGTLFLCLVTKLLLILVLLLEVRLPSLAALGRELDLLPSGDTHCEYASSQTCLRG